jgi:glycine/D-amino acid oxidase-like deaminating enzyme
MPGPALDPVENSPVPPQDVDVVIIGGGIVGVCAALELIDRGKSVAICEKGEFGAEQSCWNWGWVRLTHRDPREMPLMLESVRLWKGLNARIGQETGYRQCGVTYMVATDQAFAKEQAACEDLNSYQIPARMLNKTEAMDAFSGLSGEIVGGLHNPLDGRAEPQMAAPAIARAVQLQGGFVLQNCAVRTVETSDGTVSSVITEIGRINCKSVLVAGGVWSRLFLGNLGIHLPQLRTKNSVLRTEPLQDGPEENVKTGDFAIRKRLDGGYTIASAEPSRYELTPDSFRLLWAFLPTLKNEWKNVSLGFGTGFFSALRTPKRWTGRDITPFEKTRILDPDPDRPAMKTLLDIVKSGYKPFQKAKVAQKWAGYIDVLPDVIPVISATEGVENGVPGLFVASGFSGHGFGLGTGAGLLAADLITQRTPCVDPTPFRLHRFTDGSKIEPMKDIIAR